MGFMEPALILVAELALHVQVVQFPANKQEQAEFSIQQASIAVLDEARTAGQVEPWTIQTCPARVKSVVGTVAKRFYKNRDNIKTEGAIGPIGGDTFADDFAAGLYLTEAEAAIVAGNVEGGPENDFGAGTLTVWRNSAAITPQDYVVTVHGRPVYSVPPASLGLPDPVDEP